ncbi:MAG: hypothetical protein MUC92_04665 [Fimbriimonadaceae bacterium]|jgi:hypothetical protein|nr:hypothetical protein [Fimbriimonadaceae bacterium]
MTVSEAIDRARLTYPEMLAPQALVYLQEVVRDVLQDVKAERTKIQIDVSPGESQYLLPQGTLSVWTAAYVAGVGDAWSLRCTTEEELDDIEPLWRELALEAEPRLFFVSGSKIWLYPAPQSPTVAGYPRLVLSATVAPTLTPTTLLPTILDGGAYVEGIKAKYASDLRLEAKEVHELAYIREKEKAILAERRRQPNGPQGWRGNWVNGQRGIV